MVALVLDGGRMMQERRRAQSAADAAALSAATQLYKYYENYHGEDRDGRAADAARQIAKENGFTHDGTSTRVIVNIPPSKGIFVGKVDYAEVIIEKKLSHMFAQAFTGSSSTVRARAVARGRPEKLGIIALKNSGRGTLLVEGLAAAAIGNRVIVNSPDSEALVHDSIGLLQASSFNIVGDYTTRGLMIGRKNTNAAPTPDPLRRLPTPVISDYPVRSASRLVLKNLGLRTLRPGVYQGGIEISGLANVVLLPGEYILQGGGLDIKGLGTVTGLEVMFYSTGDGPINISGLGPVTLTSPLTGTYRGMMVFQNRSSTQPISITAISSTNVGGAIYGAKSHVTITSNVNLGIATPGGAIVADTIHINGIGNISLDLGGNHPDVPDVLLVE